MSGVGDLSLLSPRSPIFVSFPGESVCTFKGILGRLGDAVRWKSAGGASGLLQECLGSFAGFSTYFSTYGSLSTRRKFGTDHGCPEEPTHPRRG